MIVEVMVPLISGTNIASINKIQDAPRDLARLKKLS